MKILLWCDAGTAGKTIGVIGTKRLAGLIGAANRPSDWAALADHAHSCGVPFAVQPFRRDAVAYQEFTAHLAELRADLFLVNSYSMILPAPWITLPPRVER